jgi:hypothetical protein
MLLFILVLNLLKLEYDFYDRLNQSEEKNVPIKILEKNKIYDAFINIKVLKKHIVVNYHKKDNDLNIFMKNIIKDGIPMNLYWANYKNDDELKQKYKIFKFYRDSTIEKDFKKGIKYYLNKYTLNNQIKDEFINSNQLENIEANLFELKIISSFHEEFGIFKLIIFEDNNFLYLTESKFYKRIMNEKKAKRNSPE